MRRESSLRVGEGEAGQRDVLWEQDVHAVHVRDSGGDTDRILIRLWSVQEWVPQDQGHRRFLRSNCCWLFVWLCCICKKALLRSPSSCALLVPWILLGIWDFGWW